MIGDAMRSAHAPKACITGVACITHEVRISFRRNASLKKDIRKTDVFFVVTRRGIALVFCKAKKQTFFLMLCKKLRSPFKKQSPGLFFSLRSIPLLSFNSTKKTSEKRMSFLWGPVGESNPCFRRERAAS